MSISRNHPKRTRRAHATSKRKSGASKPIALASKPTARVPAPMPNASGLDASAALAHEMANLLDGGLRHLGLAIVTLRDGAKPGEARASNRASVDTLRRLDAVEQSMRRMGLLLHRWMRGSALDKFTPDRHRTLGELIEHTLGLARPRADELGVRLVAEVSPAAAALPAGPVYPAIDNAVRNCLDALASAAKLRKDAGEAPAGLVTITAAVETSTVHLCITDTGPGFPGGVLAPDGQPQIGVTTRAEGHGIGLSLIAEIAHSLHGQLDIQSNTDAARRGTRVTLRYPVASLRQIETNPAAGSR